MYHIKEILQVLKSLAKHLHNSEKEPHETELKYFSLKNKH